MLTEWKPKSGYMFEGPDGKQGFMPMPKLRFTIKKYGEQIVIQRVRVKVQSGAKKARKELGLPGMTHHESWAIGRIDDNRFVKSRSLTQREAIQEICRLSGEDPEHVGNLIAASC